MTKTGQITILGCGSSSGTPAIGCRCHTCTSSLPQNRRTRCSAYIELPDQGFLIDTGPDLRAQALRENICKVDAVLYTHPHADHLNGIDDLRAFCYLKKGSIDLLGNGFTIHNIETRFDYALNPPAKAWDKPVLLPRVVSDAFQYHGIKLIPIPVEHGRWPCLGWRIGSMAWLTDVSHIPETSMALLMDLDVLFLDCLRLSPYPSHFHLDKSLETINKLKPKRAVLIHMTHELEYQALSGLCPDGVEVGYDGMKKLFDF